MRLLLLMVAKDLRRRIRSPLGILVLLSFPILFSVMIALTFGTGGDTVPKIHLLVEDRDQNLVGGFLMSALASDEVAEHFYIETVGEDGAARIEDGEASGLLIIPENFTQDLIQGNPAALRLVRNPAQGIMPEVAEQMVGVLVEILDSASSTLREPLDQIAALEGQETPEIDGETITRITLAGWRLVQESEKYLFPPVITLENFTAGDGDEEDQAGAGFSTVFLIILPGVAVYALFLVGDLAMRDIVTESVDGTLRRQLAGPIGTGTLIMAKALYTGLLSLLSLVILSCLALFFTSGSVDLIGFISLSIALILAVTGSASVIYGSVANEQRGATVGSVIYLVLAFAGGSFVPLDSMPGSVRALAPISPFYWATQGFQQLMHDGADVAALLPAVTVLAGIGVGTLALGSALLARQVKRGAPA